MADPPKTPARKAPQHAVGVPDPIWQDCITIARLLGEKDDIGSGVPVVVRRSLARYRARHRHLLAEHADVPPAS